jgi:hypothetical protein
MEDALFVLQYLHASKPLQVAQAEAASMLRCAGMEELASCAASMIAKLMHGR